MPEDPQDRISRKLVARKGDGPAALLTVILVVAVLAIAVYVGRGHAPTAPPQPPPAATAP